MKLIPYFTYGSNMLLQRLQARCNSARFCCVTSVAGYALVFSKRSIDKSGKATLIKTSAENARAYGVVFNISSDDLDALDKFEGRGRGYDRIDNFRVEVRLGAEPLIVSTYIGDPDCLDTKLHPYDWYLDLIVAGATQNGLPEAYIDTLRSAPKLPDPDPNRPTRTDALALLASLKQTEGPNAD